MLRRIHHVGIVVRSLEEGYRFYRDTLGLPLIKEATVQDQGVRAALLLAGESEIELLEPIDPNGGVAKFLEKRGEGLHHVGYRVANCQEALDAMLAAGATAIDKAPRPGSRGTTVAFIHPKGSFGTLIELVQENPGSGH